MTLWLLLTAPLWLGPLAVVVVGVAAFTCLAWWWGEPR